LRAFVADNDLAGSRQRNHARYQAVAILTRNHARMREVHVGYKAVGGTKVDPHHWLLLILTEINLQWRHTAKSRMVIGGYRPCSSRRIRGLHKFLLHLIYQIAHVAPSIQASSNLGEHIAIARTVVLCELRLKFLVDIVAHARKFLLRFRERSPRLFVSAAQFLERHVQLKHLFQQLRRDVFRSLFADVESVFL